MKRSSAILDYRIKEELINYLDTSIKITKEDLFNPIKTGKESKFNRGIVIIYNKKDVSLTIFSLASNKDGYSIYEQLIKNTKLKKKEIEYAKFIDGPNFDNLDLCYYCVELDVLLKPKYGRNTISKYDHEKKLKCFIEKIFKKKEYFDAYSRDMIKIENKTLVRGEPIEDGIYHIVCGIIVKHKDGSILLMQRDKRKHFPLMFEATACGSLKKGEDSKYGARRELYEETGINAYDLVFLSSKISDEKHTIYMNFIFKTDIDKDSIKLEKGETVSYKWVSVDELINYDKDKFVCTNGITDCFEIIKKY